MNQYASAETIPNPEFVKLKDIASRLVDDVLGVSAIPEWVRNIRREYGRFQSAQKSAVVDGMETQNLTYMSGISEVAGKLKKLLVWQSKAKAEGENVQRMVNWYVSVLSELAPVAAIVADLKGKAVKRQPKAPEDKVAKYVAPMASVESGKVMLAALTEMSRRVFDELKASLVEYYTEQAHRMNVMTADEQRRHIGYDIFKIGIWERVGEDIWVSAYPYRYHKLGLKGNYQSEIAKTAEQQAKDIQNGFVVKNAAKMGSLLDGKQSRAGLDGKPGHFVGTGDSRGSI